MKIIKKSQILNEIAGYPEPVRYWSEAITNEFMSGIKYVVNNFRDIDWNVEEKKYKGNVIEVYNTEFEIPAHDFLKSHLNTLGYDYNNRDEVKNFLKSKEFSDLPIYKVSLIMNLFVVDEDIWEENKHYPVRASLTYDTFKTNVSKLGNIKILSNVGIEINPGLNSVDIVNKTVDYNFINKKIKTSITHELTHLYQLYKTHNKTGKFGFGSEEIINKISDLTPKTSNTISDFLHLIYLSLSFEINARVSQIYEELKDKNINSVDEFISELKNTLVWNEMSRLINFSKERFFSDLEMEGKNIKDFKTVLGDTMNQITQKMKSSSLLSDNKTKKIFKTSLKSPEYFFNFWEKRFHERGNEFKRKLLKVASIIVSK